MRRGQSLRFDRSMVVTGLECPAPVPNAEQRPFLRREHDQSIAAPCPPDPAGWQESQSVWTVPSDTLSFFNAERVTNANCWLSGAQNNADAPSEPAISSA